ncbi:MAG: hypothetical protein ACPKPY_05900 [Nitrososphaeraceae archaeon]
MILVVGLACFLFCRKGERLIGKIPVDGLDNVFFRLYQQDEFDYTTALLFDIVDHRDTVIARKHFMTGTLDHVKDLEPFTTGCYDSIVYLTYIDSNRIYGVFDLKENWGYPQGHYTESFDVKFRKADKLIGRLKDFNFEFYANYKD